MFTLTNKLKKKPLGLILLVLFAILSVHAETIETGQNSEFIIDVVDQHFRCNGYDIPLADMDIPIAVGIIDGNVTIKINTPTGIQKLSLGQGSLSLTENAVSFVSILEQAVPSALQLDAYDICSVCGRSLGIGYHQELECGHYGCIVLIDHVKFCSACDQYMCNGKDHTSCPHCKVRMCVHENIKCEYMRNPAPTPYSTKVPGGAVQSYQFSDDYSSIDGTINGRPREWTPGIDYERRNATPPPKEVTLEMFKP